MERPEQQIKDSGNGVSDEEDREGANVIYILHGAEADGLQFAIHRISWVQLEPSIRMLGDVVVVEGCNLGKRSKNSFSVGRHFSLNEWKHDDLLQSHEDTHHIVKEEGQDE